VCVCARPEAVRVIWRSLFATRLLEVRVRCSRLGKSERAEDGPFGLFHCRRGSHTLARTMPTPESGDPRSWFDENELEVCPSCKEQAVPKNDAKVAVCLACEVVWVKNGEPQALA